MRTLKLVISFGLALCLVWLAWAILPVFQSQVGPVLLGLGYGLVIVLFALTIGAILAYTPLSLRWQYRLVFLICTGMSLIRLVAVGGLPSSGDSPTLLPGLASVVLNVVVAVLAGFLGGLILTSLRDGLWENNAPPSTTIQEQVFRKHQEVLGPPTRTPWVKRFFDVCLASLGLILLSPVWLVSVFLIWFEDPGPLLFVKNSVGKDGVNFRQFKFRTMVRGAEDQTGPVLAAVEDRRVLKTGRFLRKTALDELPQLINICLGEMSFVGPRPQRTVLVHDYLQSLPEYAERHRVLPGLAGLAQVAGDYYLSPLQKLRFDRLYIQHASLGFDLKLIIIACLIAFWFRWQKGWSGRIPRKLL